MPAGICHSLVSGPRMNDRRQERSIDGLFQRHHQTLWRLALRLASDRDGAMDLVQETFVRAATRPLPADLRSAEAWLVRTLVNLSRDLHRWRKVRETHVRRAGEAARPSAPGSLEDRVVARLTVERALRRLSPRRRAILVLRDLEGLETRRVGELLGLRTATVRWHLAAARRELKSWLESERREEA